MRIATTLFMVALMAAAFAGLCSALGVPPEWCDVAALAGWSLGLLVTVALWSATAVRIPARN